MDISKHEGLIDGLDRKGSTGSVAPYFADFSKEIIFHVATLMSDPTTDNSQQKQHVIGIYTYLSCCAYSLIYLLITGEDYVVIAWSESEVSDYIPSAMSTSPAAIHIVIHPISSGLFHVRTMKHTSEVTHSHTQQKIAITKQPRKVVYIGPLMEDAAVSLVVLPKLVRETAINAYLIARAAVEETVHP